MNTTTTTTTTKNKKTCVTASIATGEKHFLTSRANVSVAEGKKENLQKDAHLLPKLARLLPNTEFPKKKRVISNSP